jgi:hypothetical protein
MLWNIQVPETVHVDAIHHVISEFLDSPELNAAPGPINRSSLVLNTSRGVP